MIISHYVMGALFGVPDANWPGQKRSFSAQNPQALRYPPGHIWVCLKMLCTPKPNGFADHYPY